MSVKDTKGRFKSVKKFMEDNRATCKNWANAWSWVNEEDKIVIFGLWNHHTDGSIFGTNWKKKESREHIRLIEEEDYALKTFAQERDEKEYKKSGKVVRKSFTSELTERELNRKEENGGLVWYVEITQEPKKRTPSPSKSTKDQIRKRKHPEKASVAKQRHNKLQNKLYHYLKSIHGDDKVTMEENYVDIKVEEETQSTLYEVKIDKPVSCIRQGLGQVLSYGWLHKKERDKKIKLVIVGPDAPTKEEQEFVDFIKENLRIDFEYRQCS